MTSQSVALLHAVFWFAVAFAIVLVCCLEVAP